MDRAQKYIYEIYKRKSFSSAARALYISQPSLSATVKKHEQELGFSVFDRTKIPLELTSQGEIYIEYLEELNSLEWNMNYRIKNLEAKPLERLTVGGTSFSAQHLLPKLCGEFHRRFHDTRIVIDACNGGSGSVVFDRLKSGALELAISHRCDDPLFEAVPIMPDPIYFVMRKDTQGIDEVLPWAMTRSEALSDEATGKEVSDCSAFLGIRFIHIGKSSSIWKYIPDFVEQYSVSDCRVDNSRRFDMHYDMMREGMGAVITSESVIRSRPDGDDLVYFKIKAKLMEERNILIVYKKDVPLSKTALDFINLAKEMGENREKLFP